MRINALVRRLLAIWIILGGYQAAGQSLPAQAGPSKPLLLTGTEEAALGQPRVEVQLRLGQRILTAEPPVIPHDLTQLADGRRVSSFTAYLDTGASGCVLSRATAERFDVERERDAAFHEVGLHGESVVDVAAPLELWLKMDETTEHPRRRDPPTELGFTRVIEAARLQVSREKPPALLGLVAGEMNVIGMPAIKDLLVEIDPVPLRGLQGAEALRNHGPRVRLLRPSARSRPRAPDITIELEPIDFSRRKHPGNRGPLPALAPNPMITGVRSTAGSSQHTCDWLLDTGAAASVISTRHAQALGLLNADGTPARPPDFTLPLGGLGGGGAIRQTPGFIIDGLRIAARVRPAAAHTPGERPDCIEFRRVHVVVLDVTATLDDGRTVTLDGILGMNMLLPSASGVSDGQPDIVSDGPFERLWIDGQRSQLLLSLRRPN